MKPEDSLLSRNRSIVHSTISLIAAPFEAEEQPKGGTWYTIRYARKVGNVVVLILPNGTIVQS
jgi:predicted Rossmann fold nucleotide-binding protein DprA/Smf involved in DNA uptake